MSRAVPRAVSSLTSLVLVVLTIACGKTAKRSSVVPPPTASDSHETVTMDEAHSIQQQLNLQLGTNAEARDSAVNLSGYPPSKPFETCIKQYTLQAQVCDREAEKKPDILNYEHCMSYINSVFQSCDTPKSSLSALKN